MPVVEIRIPQLGEGLQEARIIRFLKRRGDPVARDEPIYEMETDKAVMEIESPSAGILGAWEAKEDDVLPIGAVIGSLNPNGPTQRPNASTTQPPNDPTTQRPNDPTTQRPNDRSDQSDSSDASGPNAQRPMPNAHNLLRTANIPPRTKAYAAKVKLSDTDLG